MFLGRSSRPIAEGLAEKLLYIRVNLKLTQKQMFERLQSGLDPGIDQIKLHASHISEYERGIREPPLRIVLEYARIVQLPMEILVDRWLFIPGGATNRLTADYATGLSPRVFWARVRRAQPEAKQTEAPNKANAQRKLPEGHRNKPK